MKCSHDWSYINAHTVKCDRCEKIMDLRPKTPYSPVEKAAIACVVLSAIGLLLVEYGDDIVKWWMQ